MSEEDKSSKTEEPTEAKLRKARQKGDVPSSKETGNMMSAFALLVLALYVLPTMMPRLAGDLSGLLAAAGGMEIGVGATGLRDVSGVAQHLVIAVAGTLAPVVLVMVLAALFGVLIQGQTVVALERIKPKLSKINPGSGFKKLFSADAFVEFGKNIAKVAVVTVIAIFAVRGSVMEIWEAPNFTPETLLSHARGAIVRMLVGATAFLAAVALIDIIWKRIDYIRKQRMSLKEIRDEHKDSEGDPHIKSKRAQLRRKRAQQRIATAVPQATVVLTNPTHYAVALRYTPGVDAAPVCVAKGADLIAAQIRRIARENEVTVVENKPLARALHAVVEVDDAIPAEHWQAVAEIIGYIMDLKRRIRRAPPEGSRLREED
ncbi:flagellar biosynthesis protein FlhB [Limimaricola hongkongensis]|uniref:Flagellar biosynthetic protein FlhB n=1 Tax=Limimaricola hongkongensis DSM 17492 TaxID=1122180 RepID=A0A017HH60_9RHOB|nr:flagellar biosynthesis protein FlhB [Limimaricola hongkongensis]EYD73645.1 Flagellar biosynthesis protein FlhB [Limimaricola hongkongensis DSM 17492]